METEEKITFPLQLALHLCFILSSEHTSHKHGWRVRQCVMTPCDPKKKDVATADAMSVQYDPSAEISQRSI